MNNKLIKITKLLLDFMFYSGIVVTLGVTGVIKYYGKYNEYFNKNWISLSILFVISGILALMILFELRKLVESVMLDNCFIEENVVSLNRMGNYSFLISLITALRMLIYLTPAVLVVILVFLIAGLFSKVLSQVFDKAVKYKIETDLTI
jgi:hypothetical protein